MPFHGPWIDHPRQPQVFQRQLQRAADHLRIVVGHQLGDPDPLALMALLSDPTTAPIADLPDTGVSLATETLLSSLFIASPNYGTRASTVLIVNADGSRRFIEHSFGPYGGRLGEVEFKIDANPL